METMLAKCKWVSWKLARVFPVLFEEVNIILGFCINHVLIFHFLFETRILRSKVWCLWDFQKGLFCLLNPSVCPVSHFRTGRINSKPITAKWELSCIFFCVHQHFCYSVSTFSKFFFSSVFLILTTWILSAKNIVLQDNHLFQNIYE